MDKRNIIKWIIISVIFFVIGYYGIKIYKIIKEKNIVLSADGLRMDIDYIDYPKTNNPVMEGVTVIEYTAIERDE